MEKYEVQLSTKAKDDLKSIVSYIKNDLHEPSIAKKYANLIKVEIQKLEHFPKKFALIDVEPISNYNLRKLIIKKYIVFYRVNEIEKIVNVERILYGSSNWINILS